MSHTIKPIRALFLFALVGTAALAVPLETTSTQAQSQALSVAYWRSVVK